MSLCRPLRLGRSECIAAVFREKDSFCEMYIGTELMTVVKTEPSANSFVMVRDLFKYSEYFCSCLSVFSFFVLSFFLSFVLSFFRSFFLFSCSGVLCESVCVCVCACVRACVRARAFINLYELSDARPNCYVVNVLLYMKYILFKPTVISASAVPSGGVGTKF